MPRAEGMTERASRRARNSLFAIAANATTAPLSPCVDRGRCRCNDRAAFSLCVTAVAADATTAPLLPVRTAIAADAMNGAVCTLRGRGRCICADRILPISGVSLSHVGVSCRCLRSQAGSCRATDQASRTAPDVCASARARRYPLERLGRARASGAACPACSGVAEALADAGRTGSALRKSVRAWGMDPKLARLVLLLYRWDAMRVSDVAWSLSVSVSTASRWSDRAECEGLVESSTSTLIGAVRGFG